MSTLGSIPVLNQLIVFSRLGEFAFRGEIQFCQPTYPIFFSRMLEETVIIFCEFMTICG
jgi:hypothetical protein